MRRRTARSGSDRGANSTVCRATPNRFVLLAETIGFGSLVIEGGDAALGGGGGGRLLFAHGIGPQLTFAFGGEVGGVGAFTVNDKGGRSLETTFTAAVPVMLRWTRFSRVFDSKSRRSHASIRDGTCCRPACAPHSASA